MFTSIVESSLCLVLDLVATPMPAEWLVAGRCPRTSSRAREERMEVRLLEQNLKHRRDVELIICGAGSVEEM